MNVKYNQDAIELYMLLISNNGELKRNESNNYLFTEYKTNEFNDFLKVLMNNDRVRIFLSNDEKTFYMFPLPESKFSNTNEDMRKLYKCDTNKEYSLNTILFLIYIQSIYSFQENAYIKISNFITIENLIINIDNYFNDELENNNETNDNNKYTYIALKDMWNSKLSEEKAKIDGKSITNEIEKNKPKFETVKKLLSTLINENYVYIIEENNICPTNKLDIFVENMLTIIHNHLKDLKGEENVR